MLTPAFAREIIIDLEDVLADLDLDAPDANSPSALASGTGAASGAARPTLTARDAASDVPISGDGQMEQPRCLDADETAPGEVSAAIGVAQVAGTVDAPVSSHDGKLAAKLFAANTPRGRGAVGFAHAGREATPVSVITSYSSLPFPRSSPRNPSVSARRRLVPANENAATWKRMREHEKFRRAIVHSHQLDGLAWSLNLSPEKACYLDALAAADKNFVRSFKDELMRQFRKWLSHTPPFAFAFEFSRAGKLHLHGALVPCERSDIYRKLPHKALRAASGEIGGQKGSTQAHKKNLFDGAEWSHYCSKTLKRTQRKLGLEKITFISRELRQQTNEAFEAERAFRVTRSRRVSGPPSPPPLGRLSHARLCFGPLSGSGRLRPRSRQ